MRWMAATVGVVAIVLAWWLLRPGAAHEGVVVREADRPAVAEASPPVRRPVPPPMRIAVPERLPSTDDACSQGDDKPADDDDAAEDKFVQRLLRQSDPKARALAVFLTPQSDDNLRAERTNELAADAMHANDPSLYAMAMMACSRNASDDAASPCQLLNLAQWSQIDPGNGVPWIRIAADARRRADAGAEVDAMYHASVANRFDADLGSFAALADQSLPPETPAPLRAQLMTAAAGVQSALTVPEGREPFAFCRQARVDQNRRQICDTLANGFVERGTTMLDRSTGSRLGSNLGWDGQRLAALGADILSLNGIAPDIPHGTPIDCAALGLARQYFADMASLGEVEALRKVAQSSRKPAP